MFCDCVSRKISSIVVRAGTSVDYIRCLSPCGDNQPPHGNGSSKGEEHVFKIDVDDEVSAVHVWSGIYIDAIQFDTRKGRFSPKYGGCGGGYRHIKPPPNMGLVGLAGRSREVVDGLEFYFGETDVGVTWKIEDFEKVREPKTDTSTESRLLFSSENTTDSVSILKVNQDFSITDTNTFTITNATTWQHAWNVSVACEQGFGPLAAIGFGTTLTMEAGYNGSYSKQDSKDDSTTKSFSRSVTVEQQFNIAPWHELKVSVQITRKSGTIPFKARLVKMKDNTAIGSQDISGEVKVDMMVDWKSVAGEEELPRPGSVPRNRRVSGFRSM